jgi:signal transduction histidine kinase
MELEWDLRVDLRIALTTPPPSATLARDIYHIIREGLINAARHGNASHARVTVGRNDAEGIDLSIADNGRGFPIPGRFTGEDLARLNFGPKTLRERITAVHGGLSLESGPTGATLRIALPKDTAA